MKVLIAGATGAIGRQLVPKLVASGHEVAGTTRTTAKRRLLREVGATPLTSTSSIRRRWRAPSPIEPEVIVHEATALSSVDMRHFEPVVRRYESAADRGTDHLLAAGRAAGIRRFVAQSFAGWPFAGPARWSRRRPIARPESGRVDAIDARRAPAARGGSHRCRLDEGIALRYGGL